MKLFFAGPSPFARYVRVLVDELDMSDQVEMEAVMGTPLDAGSIPVSKAPLGKIPCLDRPDGPAIYDSRVIARYLDERAGGRLYPATPRLWECLTLEATAIGIMDSGVLMVYEGRCRPEEKQHSDWVEGQWAKITRALDAIQERWMSHLAGPLDPAQIALACALGYLDFRMPDRDWRKSRSGLADWEASFSERESMQSTKPE